MPRRLQAQDLGGAAGTLLIHPVRRCVPAVRCSEACDLGRRAVRVAEPDRGADAARRDRDLGTRRSSPATIAYLGWFGPRGLASIVFAVIVVDTGIPHTSTIVDAAALTVTASLVLHG